MDLEFFGFSLLAAAAIACAVGMVASRNPIHSALWLIGNFVSLAVIFLMLSAPMLFAVQLIVYAGAIMVLFLFVIMFFMAPETRVWLRPPLRGQLFWGGLASVALIGLLVVALYRSGESLPYANPSKPREMQFEQLNELEGIGDPVNLAKWLFTYQVLPFELTGLVLLAALFGAIMAARDPSEEGRGRVVRFAPLARDRARRKEPDAEPGSETAEVQA